ncbi:MAG: hydantoinase B/oxoprolinase family protein, partial [Candidatus Promineifilaceae bacterium]
GIKFLAPARATITSERRRCAPYGLQGGEPGEKGQNSLLQGEREEQLPGKVQLELKNGDVLRIATPGGGGWGVAEKS